MKAPNFQIIIIVLIVLLSALSFNTPAHKSTSTYPVQDTIVRLNDGTFEGRSRASYTGEPYWGIVRIKIDKGLVTEITFQVRDSNLHEQFDGKYEKHFEGNPVYIEQSRNDWKGVQTYPGKLLELKDIRKVDVVSGATWSYNIFKASLEEALKAAKIQ